MSRLTKLLMVVLLSGVFLMVAPRRAFACSCPGHGNALYESPKADAVFVGRIIGGGWPFAWQQTIFDVSTVWKGPETSTITISGVGSLCDFPFDANYEYLVYAYQDQNGLHASRCSRTMVTSFAQTNGEFARLGPGKTIIASREPTNWAVYGGAIFGVLALMTSIVVWARRSKRRVSNAP
jgi:hypothetical protein